MTNKVLCHLALLLLPSYLANSPDTPFLLTCYFLIIQNIVFRLLRMQSSFLQVKNERWARVNQKKRKRNRTTSMLRTSDVRLVIRRQLFFVSLPILLTLFNKNKYPSPLCRWGFRQVLTFSGHSQILIFLLIVLVGEIIIFQELKCPIPCASVKVSPEKQNQQYVCVCMCIKYLCYIYMSYMSYICMKYMIKDLL